MKKLSKIFTTDRNYAENLKNYNGADGIFALLLFVIFILTFSVMAAAEIRFELSKSTTRMLGITVNLFLTVITLLFVKARKQDMSSIGLWGGKWKQSCLIGLIIAGLLFFMNCGQYLLQGKRLVGGGDIFSLACFYLSVSVCEEAVFHGYIETRLDGILKKQWLSIVVTGLLFVFMHFPYRMIAYGISLQELTFGNLSWIVDLFVTHTVLGIIYAKTNSLYGAIIPHWMSNFAYAIVAR